MLVAELGQLIDGVDGRVAVGQRVSRNRALARLLRELRHGPLGHQPPALPFPQRRRDEMAARKINCVMDTMWRTSMDTMWVTSEEGLGLGETRSGPGAQRSAMRALIHARMRCSGFSRVCSPCFQEDSNENTW